ncbi:hypothetical protein HHI36_023154 [Cryptolaemus montrouzieri]|uniref:Zinc-finger domain-containing protein n=1 Tax=Cryptolaemus montrouzieri TaxID=559131 RepID=A0ABD2PFH6_9CUCU
MDLRKNSRMKKLADALEAAKKDLDNFNFSKKNRDRNISPVIKTKSRKRKQKRRDDIENRRPSRLSSSTKSVSSRRRKRTQRIILTPEEITEEMLGKIHYKLKDIIYDKIHGTSCHQCRQKTMGTKTICRNLDCKGLRGQFCGPCARNRYGVDIREALLDPYWSCFVCQQICNCSFCRTKKGKKPTGILAPIAKKEGHHSVKELLDSMNLKISYEVDRWEQINDPESVLGFENHSIVRTGNGREELLSTHYGNIESSLLRGIIRNLESSLLRCNASIVFSEKKNRKLNSF